MGKRTFRFPWRVLLYALYVGGGITGLVFLMGTIQVRSSEQACRELRIDILGEEAFVDPKSIAALIAEEFGQLEGRTLESIPIHDLEQRLAMVPYVSKARVSTDMNGLLQVQLWQRKAALRIINEQGAAFYVDQTGIKLPISSSYVPRVPVANGFIDESLERPLDSVESELVHGLFELARFISADSIWTKQIVQIYVNSERDIELVPRGGKHKILLGDTRDLNQKFEKLMIFYQGVIPKVGQDAYDRVNLKYKDQLVCTHSDAIDKRDSLIYLSNNSLNIQ